MARMNALRTLGRDGGLRRAVEVFPQLALPLRAWHQQRSGRQESELALLPWLVDPDRLAVDVGANRGVYTWQLSRLARSTWAIEANPEHIPFLNRIDSQRVTVVHAAASDWGGTLPLRIPIGQREASGLSTVEGSVRWDAGTEFATVEVPAVRLDDILDGHEVGFIKVDVEGHELAVLNGCLSLLARCRPTLLVEAEDRHRPDAVRSVHQFLSQLGYVGLMLVNGRLAPIDVFRPQIHQFVLDPVQLDLGLGHPAYVNNFIFVPGPDHP